MIKTIDIIISPEQASSNEMIIPVVAQNLKLSVDQITSIRILRKSIDARSGNIKIRMQLQVFIDEPEKKRIIQTPDYPDVSNKTAVAIVGMGPAGLFAALRLIELGIKPIILERGKDVSSRKRDVAIINTKHIVDSDSNYCFGEGGAGTFSDGKLYTRSKKRGSAEKVLNTFYLHGADESILYESHPHIGTNKLPQIIKRIRETIINSGGEVHFNKRVSDLILKESAVSGVICQDGSRIETNAVILASGHSARDIYEMLHEKGILLESKSFAVGVRVEHSQELIDDIQYNHYKGGYLPPATYSLVKQVDERGVYSFCMCPGGFIVPAATAPGEVVLNGMSPAARNSPFANAGIVVEIRNEDLNEFNSYGPLAGLKFQQQLEQYAFVNGGSSQVAPAQCLNDFIKGKLSQTLPGSSYNPGIISSPVHHWLPNHVSSRLREGFKKFGKMMHGFLTNEALVLGVESRTSSPVRIPRDKETLQHPQIAGLFPCGEGSGYAGGIVSSAIDGERCAEKIDAFLKMG